MNEALKVKLETFVENRNIISKGFKFQSDALSVASALIFVNAGVKPDVDRMKDCRKILKGKTGALSGFRGMIELMLISKMSIQEDPEHYLDDVLRAFEKVRTSKLMEYSGEIMAAINVVEMGRLDEIDDVAEKYKAVMDRMKKEHPFLTDKEDSPFAMLLALTEKDVDSIITEMEECYEYMRENFKIGRGSTQGISEVFTLYDTDVKTKCDKAVEIYKLLENRGVKYGKNREFASLGVLANMSVDANVLVDDIAEASEYLKDKEGFGNWLLGQKERCMFAAVVAAGVYDDGVSGLGGSMAGSIAVAIVEEIEITMIITTMNTNILLFS